MAAKDLYPGSGPQSAGVDAPIIHAQKTLGDNVNDLDYVSRGILIGTAGNVKVTLRGDANKGVPAVDVILPLVAGWNPVRASKIWSDSLTAVDVTAVT